MSNNTYYAQPSVYTTMTNIKLNDNVRSMPSAPYIDKTTNHTATTIYEPNQLYQTTTHTYPYMANVIPQQYYVYSTPNGYTNSVCTYNSQQYNLPNTQTVYTPKLVDDHCHKNSNCYWINII